MPSLDSHVRVKKIYPVTRISDLQFRIGARFGPSMEVTDPKQHLWTLVSALDGDTPLKEVIRQVCRSFPELTAEDVTQAVQHLDHQGLLEEATATPYDEGGELDRYAGNVDYFSSFATAAERRGEEQDRLRGARVVLFGLGGEGSFALPLLLATGFGSITAVDHGRIERTDLNRQFLYKESDVGALRTQVAARLAAETNPGVSFTAVQQRIRSADEMAELVHGADVAIGAIDELPFVMERFLNAGCVAERVPYVCGGSFITSGGMFSVRPGTTGCLECLHRHHMSTDARYLSRLETSARADAAQGSPTPAFAPHVALLASLVVAEAVRMITAHAQPLALGQQIDIHYETGRLERLTTWERDREGCPVCGDGVEGSVLDNLRDVASGDWLSGAVA